MCLFPFNAELDEFGKIKIHHNGALRLPCGKCTECLQKRAIDWGTRVHHELSCHDFSSFITLTYDEENLPPINDFKRQFKVFMDKLRKHLKFKVRYIVSHEYGSQTYRPHHHAIIFGWLPKDLKYLKKTESGSIIYRSPELESIWTKGFSSVGEANAKTAYYIANYALKGKKQQLICPTTGELVEANDSMDCSKRPAIGLNFLKENYLQLVTSEKALPRYYIKKLKQINPTLHEHYENERMFKLKNRGDYEILAKYTIDTQKNTSTTTEFRSTSENFKEDAHLSKSLKYNRDEYRRILKKDEK